MLRAVNMTAEMRTLLGEFAITAERKYLEAATIGEYRSLPAIELVQAAGFADYIHARTQIQMIGIAKNYLRLYVVAEFMQVHTFHCAGCADRHKYWSLYSAVVGFYQACSGLATGGCGFKGKFHVDIFTVIRGANVFRHPNLGLLGFKKTIRTVSRDIRLLRAEP